MKILLAIDGSEFSAAALRMLITQNNPEKTRVRLLHVVEVIPAYDPDLMAQHNVNIYELQQAGRKHGRVLTERATDKLQGAGFKVESRVELGTIRTTIVDMAASWNADLIMVGSHGTTGGLKRFLLGSVSEYVARHASCSVQVVRLRPKK